MRAIQLAFVCLMVVALTLSPTHASFSAELEEGMKIRWEVVIFRMNGEMITETSSDHFIHQDSKIEVEILKDPTAINLSDSLDVSTYFRMTYDERLQRDLSTSRNTLLPHTCKSHTTPTGIPSGISSTPSSMVLMAQMYLTEL